jgi:hypothetical protein
MMAKIKTEKQYKAVMKTIESLLEKATKAGGFHKLERRRPKCSLTFPKLPKPTKTTC